MENPISATIYDFNRFKRSPILDALRGSVMGGAEAEKAITAELKKQLAGSKITMPTFQYFRKNMLPSVDAQLIKVYDKAMSSLGIDTKGVSDQIKVVQGALLDGVMFVRDKEKGTHCLATMNPNLIKRLSISVEPSWGSVRKANLRNEASAYRIDVQGQGNESWIYKGVAARDFVIDDVKPDEDRTKRFTLIPYHFVEQLIGTISKQLDKDKIIQVVQNIDGGMQKTYFITTNDSILSDYCDEPSQVVTDVEYFTDLGYFSAPVIGASSESSLVTNIEVFNIDSLSLHSDKSVLEEKATSKPSSPLRDALGEGLVCREMVNFLKTGDNRFNEVCKLLSIPKSKVTGAKKTSVAPIAKCLRTVAAEVKEKVYNICGVKSQVDNAEDYISNMSQKPLDLKVFNEERMPDLLRYTLLQLVLQDTDTHQTEYVYCSNSGELLKHLYGPDYIRVYDSVEMRGVRVCDWVDKKSEDRNSHEKWALIRCSEDEVRGMLQLYGFPDDEKTVERVSKIIFDHRYISSDYLKNRLLEFLAEQCHVDINPDAVLAKYSDIWREGEYPVRTLSGFIDYDGNSCNFIRRVKYKEIVRGTVIGLEKGLSENISE